jgi:multidrug resistance efflux pump
LTPSQARGLQTRAQIRAPFDGEIISLKTRLSNTIDNVNAKIDNVKAKIENVKAQIRDEED